MSGSNLREFRNPNQQSDDSDARNTLIMFAMIVLIILGMQMFLPKKISAPLQPKAALVVLPPKIEARREFLFSPSGDSVQAVESATTVENELYRITFTNRGAMVTSWILKKYKDSDGKPLDLVHSQAAREVGFPLSLYTYDTALTAGINEALYVPSAAGNLVAPASLTFTYSDGGVQVRKTFSFDESYVVHADVEVRRNGAPVRSLISWPGGFGDQDNIDAYTGAQLDFARNAKEQHVAAKKVSGGETLNGPFDWAGSSDTYFAAIFLPDSPATATMVTLRNQLDVTKSIRRGGFRWSSSAIEVTIPGVALGDVSGRTETRIYAGPKAVSVLRNIHATHSAVTLEPLLDFGFFGLIGKYLFLTLQFLHAHVVSNWGWAIVLLTALINLLLLPLRIKTIQSSLKMQRIQPQMEAIKERYKKYKTTDPKRNEMNVEIMKLQKDNGVNMFGGCIPTLIQTPLLIAFFSMLPKVVELRQAHWLWVPDLSSADPYHILPIVFVVSMVLSQLLTPSPGVDRSQQRMMAFVMPAIFGFTTWSYGSGVALYWACSNLIGVIQQLVMNRMNLGR
jgi:YidC/Oxa1 family membrane protein insertase